MPCIFLRILTRSAYMQFLAMCVVYLAGDHHLDHNYTDIPRRDNHVMNTRCHMDTRSRTCV